LLQSMSCVDKIVTGQRQYGYVSDMLPLFLGTLINGSRFSGCGYVIIEYAGRV